MNGRRATQPAMVVPELNAKPRRGYARGAQGVEQILRTSERLLIAEGMEALTMRRIADECGMLRGNLTYYFKSKRDLIEALVDAITASYRAAAHAIRFDDDAGPEARFRALVGMYLENVATERTTRLFTELWALAGRDPRTAERLRSVYDGAIALFAAIIGGIEPGLGEDERTSLATFVVASLEGQTAFVGHAMPYREQGGDLRRMACDGFVALVHDRARALAAAGKI